jgi:hypothetical protein
MLTKVKNTVDLTGRLSALETRRVLSGLKTKAGRARAENRKKLDVRETARFIAENARILRSAALGAGLAELSAEMEETYYRAYALAREEVGKVAGGADYQRLNSGPAITI